MENLTRTEFLIEDGHSLDVEEAQNSLEFIKSKMREADMLVHSCKAHFGLSDAMAHKAHELIEEALSDLLSNEWHEAYQIFPSIMYSRNIPSFVEAL